MPLFFISSIYILQVYSKVAGEPVLDVPTIDVSSREFYGEGYDDSDRRIPDMTIISNQLGTLALKYPYLLSGQNILRQITIYF